MNQLNLFPKVAIKEKETKSQTKNKFSLDTYKKMYAEISWKQLLLKMLTALRVPFIAAKHQVLISIKNYWKTKPFPWFRLALVLLFVYVFFQKDMRFNINLGAPPAILSEEENSASSKLTMGNFAQTTNYSTKKTGMVELKAVDVEAYIRRFRKVALVEMDKFGIPASIKMGQAILASHAGKNSLAQQYNNHFATTCNGGANCQNIQIGSQSAMVNTYQSAWESWRNHSQLLSTPTYEHLKTHNKNYKKWAQGLVAAGYGNTNNYSQQLIQIIETYQLYKLDSLNENL